MRLQVMSTPDADLLGAWRNIDISGLRTPHLLTSTQQLHWYTEGVCNPRSGMRYWKIIGADGDGLDCIVGFGGLCGIQWENRIAEISLIIEPQSRGLGKGGEAVKLILSAGFNQLNLKTIYGECYYNNDDAVEFWGKITMKYNGTVAELPNRKYWGGKYYNSLYFSIDADEYRKHTTR